MDLPFKIGDRLPDVRLGSMGGKSVSLSEYAGRKKLVYVWASWCGCRERLTELQEFHVAHPDLPVITIACDAQGIDLPMRYLTRAKATYETWIDANCILGRRWKLKRVSVLLLLDENDVLLLAAEAPEAAVLAQVEKALLKEPAKNPPAALAAEQKDTRVEFLVQQCTNYLTRKRIEDAVGFLKHALAVDPENRVIPKQIWALQNPERFYSGAIDKEWQKSQPPVV